VACHRESSIGRKLMDNLSNLIEKLDVKERDIIYKLIKKIKKQDKDVNELSIVHNLLKSDMSIYGDGSVFQEMSSMVAPPLVKKFNNIVEVINLPTDFLQMSSSFEKVISARSSKRNYTNECIKLNELSTLLYYSYGVRKYMAAYNTQKFPLRMAPSSGGLQGVELYTIINNVDNLKKGIYHYNPFEHSLELIEEG